MTDISPENAIQDVRAEFINETTVGETPADPDWSRLSDYIVEYPLWDGDAGTELTTPTGGGDPEFATQGAEEHSIGCRYYMQRFFVDSGGSPVDPIGEMLDHTYGDSYDTQSVQFRREATEGGNDNAGYRHYVVGRGCYPTSGTVPGDPAENKDIINEVEWTCEKVETHVIHQPSSSTTVSVSGLDSGTDIIIEDEGAGTTETLNSDGTTTASFSDIDAIELSQSNSSDVTIDDGSVTFATIAGDSIEGDLGVPALGSGSHASAIGTTPGSYLFLGTDATFGGSNVAVSPPNDRIHAFDLSVEIETAQNPRQGSRRQSIDIGNRTVTVDAQVAGPYEAHEQNRRYFDLVEGDIVYSFPDGAGNDDTVTVKNANITSVDQLTYQEGDEAIPYSVTFQGKADSTAGEAVVVLSNAA